MPTKKNGASRLDRIEAAIEELSHVQKNGQAETAKLRSIVDTLAASVVAHDNHIDALIHAGEKQQQRLDRVVRDWQAYLRRLPPQ